jgi:hypothetical protein
VFTRKSISLIAALLAIGVLGISATSAWATTVTPAGAEAQIEAKSNQTFTVNNGAGAIVTCKKVTGKFTVPAATKNTLAEGSVTTDFTQTPAYSECENNLVGGTTTVTTNATNGKWSIDAMDFPDVTAGNGDLAAGDVAAIGVPKAGAEINIVNAACTIVVSPEEASAVIAAWHDGTKPKNPEGSWVKIKDQVNFTGCGQTAPASYAGEIWVNNITAAATAPIAF